jgi:hypothetical protein
LQEALKQLMCYVYEDDRCGSGLLYLAAGCSMSCKALSSNAVAVAKAARRSSARRPAGFDFCAAASSSGGGGSSIGVDNAAQAAVVAAAEAAVKKHRCFGSSSSSSSGSAAAAADAGRAEVLRWVLQATADQPLDLSLVNAR